MRELSEGEKLYWQNQKEAKDRTKKDYGILGFIKSLCIKKSSVLDCWEYAEEEMRNDKIKKIYRV